MTPVKQNNGNGRVWVAIGSLAVLLIVNIVAASMYCGRMAEKVDANSEARKEVQTISQTLVGIQRDIQYLRQGVDEIRHRDDGGS